MMNTLENPPRHWQTPGFREMESRIAMWQTRFIAALVVAVVGWTVLVAVFVIAISQIK